MSLFKMKHTPETAKLFSQINGKEVLWIFPDKINIPAIMIAPPGGSQVSVKPLVDDLAELAGRIEKVFPNTYITLEKLKHPTFCLTSIELHKDVVDDLQKLAAIPIGGDFNFEELFNPKYVDDDCRPTCPYGGDV